MQQLQNRPFYMLNTLDKQTTLAKDDHAKPMFSSAQGLTNAQVQVWQCATFAVTVGAIWPP